MTQLHSHCLSFLRSNTKRFPEYLLQLLQFDGVAAISESSKEELQSYWGWLGVKKYPILRAIPLGVDLAHTRSIPSFTQDQEIKILCVGSIEGRKNQLSLLKAADVLWQHGKQFKLTLIGLANRSTGWAAIRLIKDLRKKGRSRLHGKDPEAKNCSIITQHVTSQYIHLFQRDLDFQF